MLHVWYCQAHPPTDEGTEKRERLCWKCRTAVVVVAPNLLREALLGIQRNTAVFPSTIVDLRYSENGNGGRLAPLLAAAAAAASFLPLLRATRSETKFVPVGARASMLASLSDRAAIALGPCTALRTSNCGCCCSRFDKYFNLLWIRKKPCHKTPHNI